MCLAKPVQIKKIQGQKAILNDNRRVDLTLVPNVKKGDWLLCHADLAINQISSDEARKILTLIKTCSHQH